MAELTKCVFNSTDVGLPFIKFALSNQRTNPTLNDIVVYRIAVVLNISENIVPKLAEIVKGCHQIRSCLCRILGFLYIQVLSHTNENKE